MQQWKIGTQIMVLGVLALSGMLLIGLIGYVGNQRLVNSIESVSITSTLLRNQTEADMMHDGIRADVLDMFRLSTQESPSAEELNEVRGGLAEHLQNFNRLVAENDRMPLSPNQRAAMNELKPDLSNYVRMAQATADQFEQHSGDASEAYKQFFAAFLSLEERMEKFSSLIENDIHQATDQQKAIIEQGQLLILLSVVILLVALAIAVGLVTRGITRPIKSVGVFLDQLQGDLRQRLPDFGRNELGDMGRAVNELITNQANTVRLIQRAAEDVGQVALQLKDRSNLTHDLTEQVNHEARHIDEITSQLADSVEEVLQRVDLAAQRALTASNTASEAHASMFRSHEVTADLINVAKQASGIIENLGSAANEISSIAAVIKEIADQTNLLALNAAIEAARAGESGRGFAVVADEVRKLAERTAASTTDIAKMTQHITQATGEATRAMHQVSDGVNRGALEVESAMTGQDAIVRDTEDMKQISDGIARAAQQETAAIADATAVLNEISTKIENASEAVQTMNSDTDTLSRVVAELQKNVAQFKV
ncbi:methyl-accepting chemotaxis protein [Chitinibacter sp. S2-10]|uniref:methyl-accepting chemotaxis protein n=1 Tax=Chitinibacter sp. S2-10 TaxID=3373597 RepID=UPI0039774F02